MVKKKKLPIYTGVEITDIGSKGKAVARVNDKVVFVPHGIPGDIMDIQIKKKKRKYMEGYPIKIHNYSEKRVNPFCEHFGVCGGCKWQHLEYREQLFYKKKQVIDNIDRIGHIDHPNVNDVFAAVNTTYYRNKLEFTFSNRRWLKKEEMDDTEKQMNGLGFHVSGLFDKVVDIEHCFLQRDPSNEIRQAIKNYALDKQLSFFDIRNQYGLLRNLIIRTTSTGDTMIIISFFYEDKKAINNLLNFIAEKFPGVSSIMYVINPKGNDTIDDLDIRLFKGNAFIRDEIDGLIFKIGPKSFYQTNAEQTCNLYKLITKQLNLKGEEIVYDLYTGIGTIALFVARYASKVIGIEYVPSAIDDAKENASINQINNTDFYAGDIKDVFSPEIISKHGHPDVIIIDPPRAGMHPDVVENILKLRPGRIVYVSCNVATQARDINLMKDDYMVTMIQPVDMFPHTQHIENIVFLDKTKQS